jgi:hypothetical protein
VSVGVTSVAAGKGVAVPPQPAAATMSTASKAKPVHGFPLIVLLLELQAFLICATALDATGPNGGLLYGSQW